MKNKIIVPILVLLMSQIAYAAPNPSAAFCVDQGNDYIIKKDIKGKDVGFCIINGTEVSAWDHYRKSKGISKKFSSDLKKAVSGPSATFDWRDGGWVSPVKDQSGCGSCWAFAATGVLESKIKISLNDSDYDIDLSEQDLISCAGIGNCSGGGDSVDAFRYIKENGIVKESCNSYSGTDSACSRCVNADNESIRIEDYGYVNPTIEDIENAINNHGPISAYLISCPDFGYYTGGVYSHEHNWSNCDYNINLHELIIVGYSHDNYWIVKNSWGLGWGEEGYAKIAYSETITDPEAWWDNISDYRVFFINESWYITNTDIDSDGLYDSTDPCPELRDSNAADSDCNACVSLTEYNDFKYEYKNGLLQGVSLTEYNDLKYAFKNGLLKTCS